MIDVAMVGVSHRTAPLPLLERVAVPVERRAGVLAAVRAAGFAEVVLLTTCSRTEIYAAGDRVDTAPLLDVLAGEAGSAFRVVRATAEIRTGGAVLAHLLRVASGLESRVVGEPEIRSQVRTAFREAAAAGSAGGVLGELFALAGRTATRVHRETTLGSSSRSLACRAVDLGLAEAGGARPGVVVMGSGRMASAAVGHLRHRGHLPLVAARDQGRAEQLAGAGHARPLEDLVALLRVADVVICTTSAGEPLLTPADVCRAMVGRCGPLTLVDLSVPRNVDPAVAAVAGVRVLDLEAVADHPAGDTGDTGVVESVVRAEALVAAAARRHRDRLAARRAGPVIAEIRDRVEQRCLEAVSGPAPATCSPEDLARLARRMAGRLAHPSIMAARAAAAAGDDVALLTICGALDVALTPAMVGLGARTHTPGRRPEASLPPSLPPG